MHERRGDSVMTREILNLPQLMHTYTTRGVHVYWRA